jgi:tetratricopeptide (TPR) repeat protein
MRKDEQHADLVVDFDSVWEDLIKPALAAAGCEPFRADSELSAGDIRTDMFFELVTADLVVADLSIPNPNIYYELGVRDGVCARGVFIINGGWDIPRPFDVSQDRSFSYRGDLFQVGAPPPAPTGTGDTEDLAMARQKEVKRMAEMFGRAVASDPHETGSPVYSHLPGLKAANWAEIDISRARYFWSLQSDWQERVRRAQELVRPGHILTISQYAPTRVHRTKILSEAARALIGLEQFSTAESILEEILEVTPEDTEAQLYLAIAQINGQDILRAERQLRKMLQQHQGDPQTNMALGYVYRLL